MYEAGLHERVGQTDSQAWPWKKTRMIGVKEPRRNYVARNGYIYRINLSFGRIIHKNEIALK